MCGCGQRQDNRKGTPRAGQEKAAKLLIYIEVILRDKSKGIGRKAQTGSPTPLMHNNSCLWKSLFYGMRSRKRYKILGS
jgi:hypothetical protein